MPTDTPDSPGAGGVFSGGAASKPPEAEHLPSPGAGRPAHVPSDAIRREIEINAAALIPQEHIAALVGISRKTLLKHYQEELALGDAQGCARGAMALSKLIEEGSKKGSAHDLLEIAR